jgi:hypothetical protein
MGIPTLQKIGPASGTYTAAPTANRIGVYMVAGGSGTNASGGMGDYGAVGGWGFWNKPITQPFSQPYSVGGGGAGAAHNAGAGGNTTIANVGTANAGTAPVLGNQGTAGTAPGASFTPPAYNGGSGTVQGRDIVIGRPGSTSGNAGSISQIYGGTDYNTNTATGLPGVIVVF